VIEVTGVLLNPGEADYVARALDEFAKLLPTLRDSNGKPTPKSPTPRLVQVTAKLRAAVGTAAAANGTKSALASVLSDDADHGHAIITCAEAARILGCRERNVRALAQRGRLRARRAGARWNIDAMAVAERIERRSQE
jgi:excisionase family DNA binding protein